MIRDSQTSGVFVASHPVLRILVSFPIACFCGALVTDIAYAWTTDMMWADFSAWLLAVGMILGVLAAIAGLVALVRGRRLGVRRPVWPMALGSVVVLALGGLDNLVHSRDAWTSVVPLGLVVSALTVLVLLMTAWAGAAASPVRQGATVQYQGARR